ncbi:MAG TPA: HAD-IIIA family hydrolase [Phycisphaerae bacterium]|nr:HAD-IIIA family hydrolase [Phycisphaerae bacterium]
MAQRAVFLDRDNTIIADPGYLNDPDAVQLLPGVADALRRLNEAKYCVVVVTNQSGVARGRITEQQLADVHTRMREMLLEQGARLDAVYYCPYLAGVEATVPRYRKQSPLRKPEPGMLLRAADELQLGLPASWMVGDSARDIIAGRRAGCRTILLKGAPAADTEGCQPDFTVDDLTQAVDIILAPAAAPEDIPPVVVTAEPAPTPPANREPSGPPAPLETAVAELTELLRRQERRERQEDFSVARLLATLAQMLALAAGVWGLARLIGGKPAAEWLLLAVLLQLAVLTALAMGRR